MTRRELTSAWSFIEVPQCRLAVILEQRAEAIHYPWTCPHCGRRFNGDGPDHLLDFKSAGICCTRCAELIEGVVA